MVFSKEVRKKGNRPQTFQPVGWCLLPHPPIHSSPTLVSVPATTKCAPPVSAWLRGITVKIEDPRECFVTKHSFFRHNFFYVFSRYFWHITDIHYDANYVATANYAQSCKRSAIDRELLVVERPSLPYGGGRLGDYGCDSPWTLVQSAVKAMKEKHGDNIEFVLWSGYNSMSEGSPNRSLEWFLPLSRSTVSDWQIKNTRKVF
ncbi:hypothetical protein QTP88_002316 [Uroleucon formosanum]